VKFLEVSLLRSQIESMVKMSPLQSFSLEVLEEDDETALIGAGVSAVRALTW
jgi:glucokinase